MAMPASAADAAPAPRKEGQVPGGDADAVMAGSSDEEEADEGLVRSAHGSIRART